VESAVCLASVKPENYPKSSLSVFMPGSKDVLCLFCLAFNNHDIQFVFLVVGQNCMVANIIFFLLSREAAFSWAF
jgi:hypothetical protein